MHYDIFISYRRENGSQMARLLSTTLEDRGYKCFLDVEELKAGHFDEALLRNIEASPNFLVVLSPGCLERCKNEGDWLRNEIAHAIALKKKIIPVMLPGFDFPPKADLPEEIRELDRHQAVLYSNDYFKAMLLKLCSHLGEPGAQSQAEEPEPKPQAGSVLENWTLLWNNTPSRGFWAFTAFLLGLLALDFLPGWKPASAFGNVNFIVSILFLGFPLWGITFAHRKSKLFNLTGMQVMEWTFMAMLLWYFLKIWQWFALFGAGLSAYRAFDLQFLKQPIILFLCLAFLYSGFFLCFVKKNWIRFTGAGVGLTAFSALLLSYFVSDNDAMRQWIGCLTF